MSIILTLKVNSENAVKDATDLTNQLKIKNLRGVKVRQEEAEPTEGALAGGGEWLPYVQLVIESGLATAVVTQLFGLLKNGFFTKTQQIKAEKEIKLKELEMQERISQREYELKMQELAAQQKSIDLIVEYEGKKINLKELKDNNAETILQTLKDFIDG